VEKRRIVGKTVLGMILLSILFSIFVLTLLIYPVVGSDSLPGACDLPRWLLAFIFVMTVLAGGILAVMVVFLVWWRRKPSRSNRAMLKIEPALMG